MFSVVTPAYNEAEGLPKLIEELRAVLEPLADEYEIIVDDDGSQDETLGVLGGDRVTLSGRAVTVSQRMLVV